ncbi:MAG: hypothetical protein JNK21_08520 [Rhodospirillaceae bacterium]|nr:hypothetical protein [Rhodospirillaceae bacterium]
MSKLFGLKIKTRQSYEGLDNILAQYCRGTYEISIGGLEDVNGVARKIMILSFAEEEDRNRIKHFFSVRKGGDKAPSAGVGLLATGPAAA